MGDFIGSIARALESGYPAVALVLPWVVIIFAIALVVLLIVAIVFAVKNRQKSN